MTSLWPLGRPRDNTQSWLLCLISYRQEVDPGGARHRNTLSILSPAPSSLSASRLWTILSTSSTSDCELGSEAKTPARLRLSEAQAASVVRFHHLLL